MKTKRIKSRIKGIFFTKPRKIKEELIKKDKEIEFTFKSKIEIPVQTFARIDIDINNPCKKAIMKCVRHCIIEGIEQAIIKMTKVIDPEKKNEK